MPELRRDRHQPRDQKQTEQERIRVHTSALDCCSSPRSGTGSSRAGRWLNRSESAARGGSGEPIAWTSRISKAVLRALGRWGRISLSCRPRCRLRDAAGTVWFALSGHEAVAGRGPRALPAATMVGAFQPGEVPFGWDCYTGTLDAYVRRAGHSSEGAQDLTQELFARVIGRHYLTAVHPDPPLTASTPRPRLGIRSARRGGAAHPEPRSRSQQHRPAPVAGHSGAVLRRRSHGECGGQGTLAALQIPPGDFTILATNEVIEITGAVPETSSARFFRVLEAD
jgi:hypothetical protein